MKKINVAELLKGCPSGMELDCTMYDKVILVGVDNDSLFPIKVRRKDGCLFTLTKYGQYCDSDYAKCVIFPKGKTTWEGFVPPCKFKDGDVIVSENHWGQFISIFKEMNTDTTFTRYISLTLDKVQQFWTKESWADFKNSRLATDEEKEKLFKAIKDNGYKWNSETNTLEKLIQPKFKVGDIIRRKNGNDEYIITSINDYTYYYRLNEHCTGSLGIQLQDDYELVPNKFDINTLVPFESKVLVRSSYGDIWRPAIYGVISSKKHYHYVVGGHYWIQCIPYEGNQHLLGKTDDCDDYFKTWE